MHSLVHKLFCEQTDKDTHAETQELVSHHSLQWVILKLKVPSKRVLFSNIDFAAKILLI